MGQAKDLNQENGLKANGKSNTRIYKTWSNMKGRCYSPKYREYKHYGGRGIKVCNEWKSNFETFYEWAINNGYMDNLTIERINVNGDYCPSNCTWIDQTEQQQNKRNTVYLTHNGKTLNIHQWSKITGLSKETILRRKHKGWNDERALTEPCIKSEKIKINRKITKEKNTPILENLLQFNSTCGIISVEQEKGRKSSMFWEKVFGEMLLERIKKYCEPRKMSITSLVRIAVEKYLKENEASERKK